MRIAGLIVLYVGAAALGTYLVFRPTFDSGFAATQTERGDGMLNHYLLEHSWLALSDPDYCGGLLSPPMFAPTKWTIYYSENLWGAAPLYWALRPALPHDLAYIWWQIVLNALNFVAFAVVARWLKWPHLVAVGGAFLWAFAVVHADQIKHQQMIGRAWMPLAAYYALALVREPSARALNRLCACVFLQCLTCIYTGWFLVAGLGVFVPALAALTPGAAGALRRFARENRRAVLRSTLLWGFAMTALFAPYLGVNWGISRAYDETHGLVPTPSAWISGPPGSMWSETTAPFRRPVTLECWLFSGFALYALMLAATVRLFLYKRDERPPERALVAASMLTVVLWVLATLTPHDQGNSLWRWVRLLPGGTAIRCVSRVYVVVYLFGGLAALTWLVEVTERISRAQVRYAVRALVVAALIFEQTRYEQPSFPRADFYPQVDAVAAQLKGAPVGYVVPTYPVPNGGDGAGPYGEVFAMWAGLRANVPVVNGYSGRAPRDYPAFGGLTDAEVRTWLTGKFRGPVRRIDPRAPGTAREIVVE
jgi:hypothetical protein